MAAADYNDVVQQLYVAYFGRPADHYGLLNMEASLNATGVAPTTSGLTLAYSTNATVKSLIDSFGTSSESATLYGTGSTASFVNAIFNHVLNRDALVAGLDFWVNAIDSGAVSKGNAALAIMDGALHNTSAQGLIDAQVVANKVTVAGNFTTAMDTGSEIAGYTGATAAATARTMLAAVTNTTDTVAYQATVTSTLATIVTGASPTFALTASAPTVNVGASGTQTLGYTLTLDHAPTSAMTLNYSTVDGTAVANTEYVPGAGTVTFAAGQTTATVTVTANGVATDYTNKTLTLHVSGSALTAPVDAVGTLHYTNVDPSTVSQTFTLTTASDNFTGGVAADTFNANIPQGGTATINAGDVLNGGAGNDTLNITSTDTGGAVNVVGVTSTAIETLSVQNLDTTIAAHTFKVDLTNFTGLTTATVQNSSGNVTFTNTPNIVTLNLTSDDNTTNANQAVNVTYQAAVVSGTADAATINLSNVGTTNAVGVTESGIETMTLNATGVKSAIGLTDTALTKLVVTGNVNLDLSSTTNMFGGADASASTAVETVDASAFTGALTLSVAGNNGTYVSIVGGSGNDSITVNNIDKNSTISGGTGTDTLTVGGTITSTAGTTDAFSNVTGFEKLSLGAAIAGTLDTTQLGGITDVTLGVAWNNNDTLDKAASGFTLRTGDYADANTVAVNITGALAGTADAINVVLNSATSTTGRNQGTISTSYVENATITSQGKTTGGITNTVTFSDTGLKTVAVNGNEALALTLANMTTVTSIDASASTGGLAMASNAGLSATGATLTGSSVADTLFGGAGNDSISAGAGNDTISMAANLNNGDTIDGGAGTSDTLTADVSGLTATTGKLNISNVETLGLLATAAATVDATNITGANTIGLLGANGGNTVKVTNLAAGATVALGGLAANGTSTAYTGTANFALANATGTADSLNIKLGTTAAQTGALVATTGIETLNISQATGVTQNNNTLDLTGSDATTVTASGSWSGKTLDLTALKATTTTVDGSGVTAGTFKTTLATATSQAGTIKGGAGANYLTGGNGNDTISIAKGFDVNDTVAGGTGTDTLNATIDATSATPGALDLSNVTAVEKVNLAVDTSVAAATVTTPGILADAGLTNFTVTGTNTLSAFTVKTTAMGAAALKSFDASGYAGAVDVLFAQAALTATDTITGGAGSTDAFHVQINALNTAGVPRISGFEQVEFSGAVAASTVDMTNVSGASTVALTGNQNLTLSNLAAGAAVDLGVKAGLALATNEIAATWTVGKTDTFTLASSSGTADALTVNVQNLSAGGGVTFGADGVENLTVNLNDATNAANLTVTDTNANAVTLHLVGSGTGLGETMTSLASSITTLDASNLAENLTMTATRSGSAMTITGGSGTNTIYMENGNDVINAGSGTGNTLVIKQLGTVGGFQVDLSSTTDQVTQYNGVTNAKAQTGFTSVDLSQVTGTFGADITANSHGSTITGTSNADTITLGAGADTVVMGTAANDSITNFTHASDIIQLGGTTAAVGILTGAGAANATAHAIVFDTAANLGTSAVNIGDGHLAGTVVHYAVASNTGAIYYDADGNWTAGVVQIGTIGVVTGLAVTDFHTA